ncbi:MAG: TrkA family potassium uptake protein [Longimicrobiales bacterium]|nr:TrkA family potassium uptake protein [Longimicrobiales bacterium]
MKRFVVIGLGNFGSTVAMALGDKGHEVIAIDRNEDTVQRVADHVDRAVVGDGTDPAVLEDVGCAEAEAAIISTGDDVTASVLAVLVAQDLKIRDVHVKVISDIHARVVDRLGVTSTIFPEKDTGARLAESLGSSAVLNYLPLSPGFSVQEMAVPDEWIGKSLRELDLRHHYTVSVVAVHDMLTDTVSAVPDPDAPLKESDTLFVAGAEARLDRVSKLVE